METKFQESERILKTAYKGELPKSDNSYKSAIMTYIRSDMVVLDAGCGRHMEFSKMVAGKAKAVIAADITEELTSWQGDCLGVTICTNLEDIAVVENSVDLIICRSVLEHLSHPELVVKEFSRVLKPDGLFVFVTPNLYDYVSVISMMTPHKLHRWLLSRLLSWDSDDIFPTEYKMNTTGAVRRLMSGGNFECVELNLVNHYPAYLMFSPMLLRIGILYERVTTKVNLLRGLRGSIIGVFRRNL